MEDLHELHSPYMYFIIKSELDYWIYLFIFHIIIN